MYNGGNQIMDLLDSVYKNSYRRLEVIIVDDASTDQSIEIVRKQFPSVMILKNHRNMGKSWSLNKAIRASSGEFLIVADPDVVFDSELIETWVAVLRRNRHIGLCGGYVYYKNRPTILTHAGAKLDWKRGLVRHQLVNVTFEYDREAYQESRDFVFDDTYILRKRAVEICGGYDHINLPTIYEEADLQMRISRAGFGKALVPGARAYHAIPTRMWSQLQRYSEYKIELFCRNRLVLLRKLGLLSAVNGPPLIFSMLGFYSFVAVIQPVSLRRRLSLLKCVIRGLYHGLFDRLATLSLQARLAEG
jgi:GT2 family glycosyltransferase